MKTVVIANPAAGAGRVGRRWQTLRGAIAAVFGTVETCFTERSGQASEIARRAIAAGAERIVVVGGDGTLNEVVNGFFGPDGALPGAGAPSLALIPAGTGGDFARSIGVGGVDLVESFAAATLRPVDVGRAELTTREGAAVTRHFINISSFGSSGLVVDSVNRTTKRFGAKASFLWGTLKALAAYDNQRVRLRIDDAVELELLVNMVAVANGRYFGGSMKIAPGARVDDGRFDVIIAGDIGLAQFVAMSRKLYRGAHLGHPQVRCYQGTEVVAEPVGSGAPVLLDLDGEQPGRLPVRYRLLPAALKLIAPWGRAEAASPEAPADRCAS